MLQSITLLCWRTWDFFDQVPIIYSAQSQSLILGALDGTREGIVGYTLAKQGGHMADSPREGMLFYFPDFDDPDQVQGGILILAPAEMLSEAMSNFLVVGGLTQGWETMDKWIENVDAILERVEVFEGDAGPIEARPTPEASESSSVSSN